MGSTEAEKIEDALEASARERKERYLKINFGAGMISGVAQASLLNPWDRALYLSVKESRPFLSPANFSHPYQGFWQAFLQRTISGGQYFAFQGLFEHVFAHMELTRNLTQPELALGIGTMAGALNGLVLNQLATVKYHTWNAQEAAEKSRLYSSTNASSIRPPTFRKVALRMYREGGLRPFFKGVFITVGRDMIFGICYEVLRIKLRHGLTTSDSRIHGAMSDMSAAAVATILSAPLNYARNIVYATPASEKHLTTTQIIKLLVQECAWKDGLLGKTKFVQERLRIGWGTARVAVGMALGQLIFHQTRLLLE